MRQPARHRAEDNGLKFDCHTDHNVAAAGVGVHLEPELGPRRAAGQRKIFLWPILRKGVDARSRTKRRRLEQRPPNMTAAVL